VLHEAGGTFLATLDKYTLADVTGQSSALRRHFLANPDENSESAAG
jgi:hypothetical protein